MAFPFLIDETFDDGTRGTFDTETDASSILDFPTYKELSRAGLSPWQGAHALRVSLSDTATAYVEDAGVLGTNPVSVWFPLLVASDVTLNDGDVVQVFQLRSSNPNPEAFVAIRRTGSDYELVAGEGLIVRRVYGTITRSNSRWYQIELTINQTAGTLDFYVDGSQIGSQVAGLSMSPFANIRVGAPSGTAAGDSGIVLVGRVIVDDARIFPRTRFPDETVWVTRDISAFVGNGILTSINFTSTGTDGVLSILDTDIYEASNFNFSREPVVYLRTTAANANVLNQSLAIPFRRGLYVQLTGTNPQVWLDLEDDTDSGIVRSHSNYVDLARK